MKEAEKQFSALTAKNTTLGGEMYIKKVVPTLNEATQIAASGFNQNVNEELMQDVNNHLQDSDLTYCIYSQGVLIGFAVFKIWDEILYLSGVIIKEGFQGQEATTTVVKQAQMDAPFVKLLALRTQSLRMWVAGSKLTHNWFPNSLNQLASHLDEAGQKVATKLNCSFPISAGCYGGPLYGQKPTHKNVRLQKWWDEICNFERGDAIICIGTLND